MWALVIIVIALNNDKTSAPAITSIPGFTSEETCEKAREKTSYGNLERHEIIWLSHRETRGGSIRLHQGRVESAVSSMKVADLVGAVSQYEANAE